MTIKSKLRKIRVGYKRSYEIGEALLSPKEKHILRSKIFLKEGHFDSWSYNEWIMRRINKILSIYDVEWFKGKKLLVLGDGIGEIGSFFADIGAEVLAFEGRKLNVNIAKIRFSHMDNYKIKEFDLSEDFSSFGRFDMIINFGLIEVMEDIDNLLECCAKMSDSIFVETLVCDSSYAESKVMVERPLGNSDSGLTYHGTHPSPFMIEGFFRLKGFKVIRLFHSDLNIEDSVCYDWKHKNTGKTDGNMRRFWHFIKDEWRI